MPNGRKKIFLASSFTEDEIIQIRNQLGSLINTYGSNNFQLIDLNDNIASGSSPLVRSLDNVKEADLVILLLGNTYGTPLTSNDSTLNATQNNFDELWNANEQLSITHLEFRYAISNNKPVFVYLKGSDGSEMDESQKNFIREVSSSVVYADISQSSAEETALKIFHDILFNYKTLNNYRFLSRVDQCDTHFASISHLDSEFLPIDDIRRQILNNDLDQKYLYIHPRTVEMWASGENTQNGDGNNTSNISFENYKHFWDELDGDILSSLLNNIDTIIDLGVGVGTKTAHTLFFLSGHTDKFDKINYVAVDYSPFMVNHTLKNLKKTIEKHAVLKDKIYIDGLQMDFMKLNEIRVLLRGKPKNTLFILSGGTFGNLKEKELLEVIKNTSVNNDYFLVSFFHKYEGAENEGLKTYQDKADTIKKMFNYSLIDLGYEIEHLWFNPIIENDYLAILFNAQVKDIRGEIKHSRCCNIVKSTRYTTQYITDLFNEYGFSSVFEKKETAMFTTLFQYKGTTS